ncbi:MAG: SLC13 family permease [Bacteroidia bacterium]
MTGKNLRNKIAIAAGPLLALFISFCFDLRPGSPQVTYMAGLAVWMATWWFTEAVSLAVTAFVPFLFMPLLGIADTKSIAQQYTDSIIFLFIGGFMIAFAIEKWGLHKRIALKVLSIVGDKPRNILLGVMLSTYLISNWISNTATTMMLLAAVLALVSELSVHIKEGEKKLAAALLLGLAFSSTIGGMATPVGTPPNMFFFKEYNKAFPMNHDLNFLTWAKIGFPLSFTFLLLTFFVLNAYFLRRGVSCEISKSYFKEGYKKLGKISYEEKVILGIFFSCVLLWFTRENVNFGSFEFKGWKNFFRSPKYLDDASVAIAAALLLFIIPSRQGEKHALLVWEDAHKIRYDIILMFGSGFALAYGFEVSGLSDWLASSLIFFKGVPLLLLIIGICTVVTIISEFASNIASIQLCIPIMIAIQKDLNVHPLLLMIPATFAASLGFILPVATASNTIAYGTKLIDVKDMLRVGFVLDVIGITLISIFVYFYLA